MVRKTGKSKATKVAVKRLIKIEKKNPSTLFKNRSLGPGRTGRKKGTGFFKGIGGWMGEKVAGTWGRSRGQAMGNYISQVTGMGSYTIRQNSLRDTGPPVFKDTPVVFKHREFIANITTGAVVGGSTVFNNTSYTINPGLEGTFPWLSTQMSGYEQYKMKGLLFEFCSRSADALNSTNTALGTVVMATNYDSVDPVFVTKQQMEAYEYSTATSPSRSALHMVECAPGKNVLSDMYVRASSVAASDNRFYDLGKFQIATEGMQAVSNIGELWVTYHVEAIRKKLPTPTGDHLTSSGSYGTNAGGTTGWFYAPTTRTGSNFNLTILNANGLVLPSNFAGRYLVVYHLEVATTATLAGVTTTVVGGTAVAAFLSSAGATQAWAYAGTGTPNFSYTCLIDVTTSGQCSITFDGTLTTVGTGRWTVEVCEVPGDYTFGTNDDEEKKDKDCTMLELEKFYLSKMKRIENHNSEMKTSIQTLESRLNTVCDYVQTLDDEHKDLNPSEAEYFKINRANPQLWDPKIQGDPRFSKQTTTPASSQSGR